MNLDELIVVICALMLVLCGVGYRHLSEHVWLRYSGWR